MSQRVLVTLTDDLDGSDADETTRFGLDGVEYEIDLNEGNAARLREALGDYVAKGRRVHGVLRPVAPKSRKQRQPPSASPVGKTQSTAIRDWANRNGYTVAARGRIPAEVLAAFDAAH